MPKARKFKIRNKKGVIVKSYFQHILIFLSVFVISFLAIVAWNDLIPQDTLRKSAGEINFDYGPVDNFVFADVPGQHKNAYALLYMKERAFIKGYDDGTFLPEQPVNRAEFVKMVITAQNLYPHKINHSNCLPDVSGQWFAPYVCFAKNKGWISNEEKPFVPDRKITRAEAIKIALGAFSYRIEGNDDQDWYEPHLEAAGNLQILNGLFEDDEMFDPHVEISRAEAAELLFRLLVIQSKYS
ncbi:hypothetical protein GF340_00630 [Candidatus Peregrinibacteria bacterium]|nr:hypothetical protein [Candidatus Peregrinibacteria bacterium]